MSSKIEKTTKKFKKDSGMILCNRGGQEEDVVKILRANGYRVVAEDAKAGKTQIKYYKEEK